jgi:hypothetical protein
MPNFPHFKHILSFNFPRPKNHIQISTLNPKQFSSVESKHDAERTLPLISAPVPLRLGLPQSDSLGRAKFDAVQSHTDGALPKDRKLRSMKVCGLKSASLVGNFFLRSFSIFFRSLISDFWKIAIWLIL